MEHLLLTASRAVSAAARTSGGRRRVRVLAACGIVVALAACGSEKTGDTEEAQGAVGPAQVILQGSDDLTTFQFRESSISDCMTSQGFDYQQQAFAQNEPNPDSLEYRQQHGFGLNDGDGGPVEEQMDTIDRSSLSPAELSALGECRSNAEEAVNERNVAFINSLPPDLKAEFEAVANFDSPLLLEATDAWHQCMADAGYDFASPIEMLNALYSGSSLASKDQKLEIQLAVADWNCSQSDEVKLKIEQAYQSLNARLAASYEAL